MSPRLRRRFWALTLGLMALWTALLGASLLWQTTLLHEQVRKMARFEAESAFERDLVYRAWNAEMGGVYAPVERVRPNPYLEVSHRELDTAIGRLTMVNPSYMTRLVHTLALERTGILSHLTSLDPIRPGNVPTGWERDALRGFEAGAPDYEVLATDVQGEAVLRFMRPLTVEQPCLKCHEQQGYALGDVRGGISVTVPLAPIQAIQAPARTFTLTGHAGLWFVGLTGIGLGGLAMGRLYGRLADARAAAEAERDRATAADHAKSRFLATMSHELRTPLTAILGLAEMMERKVFGPLGTRQYDDYAQDIRRAGDHLLALVNDVLDLSRIEAGTLALAEERVALPDLVSEAVSLLRPEAARRSVRVDVDLQTDMPALRADRRAVRQMVIALLAGALRVTPAGGRVLVSANIDNRGRPMLAVADNGPGLDAAEREAALDPFRQDARMGEGTGLELPLVKGLIERHGGLFTLHSRVGSGSTVMLQFPAHRVLPAGA